ncbi:MAG TPA: FtsW/RodA/SpoVE family cell cycle protein [Bacteroidaceae bacterium]|nr:FtsW/RodA/SpoVE family cell cycle protein [Bacteroidaceae bacterium]
MEHFTSFINRIFRGDKVIWVVMAILVSISIVEVFTSTSSFVSPSNGNFMAQVNKHILTLCIGFAIIQITLLIPFKFYRLAGVGGFVIMLGMLAAVLFLGHKGNGATRAIMLGGFSIQPSELIKPFLIVSLSTLVAIGKEKSQLWKRLTWIISISCTIMIALIGKENSSSALMLMAYCLTFLWIINFPWKYWKRMALTVLITGVLGATAIFTLGQYTNIGRLGTFKARITRALEPLPDDPQAVDLSGENTQRNHSNIAIGTSSVFGKGMGKSEIRDYISEGSNDFIYSIILEETGLVGGLIVFILYIIIMFRTMRLGYLLCSPFPSYLAIGLGLFIMVQALTNMFVAVGWMPVTGQNLPLISRGGSSALSVSVMFGLIQKLFHEFNQQQHHAQKDEADVSQWTGVTEHETLLTPKPQIDD